jgi:hypothetical protein
MKKIIAFSIALVVLCVGFIFLDGCGKKAVVSAPPATFKSAEPTSFREVTSKLDQGGDLYLYVSTEQWLKSLSEKIGKWRDVASSLPNLQGQRIESVFTVVTNVVKDSGIENISGIGMSSIAREPGVYYSKLVVHHYSGQTNGFVWTVFGKQPHALDGLDLLPANTAMAAFNDADIPQIWSVVQNECQESGFPQASEFLDRIPQQFEKNTGIRWDDVLDSLGGEFGIVVTLDETKMVTIPAPSQVPLEIPDPALMLVIKVKNDVIFNRLDELMKKQAKAGLVSVDKNGLKMRTVPVPIPVGVTLRPSIATSEGYLFVATSDAIIQEALAVKGGKPGLKSTDEFKRLTTGVPQEGNQFCFLSKRFGETVMTVQLNALDGNKQAPPQMKELMQSLIQPEKAAFTFVVGANTAEGWMAVGNGNQSGANVLASTTMVPMAGLLAAIAVPNFVKARDTAQKNACINNLRQIDGAKQQWALENSKRTSDVPTWTDLQPYLRNGTRIRCPSGGHYTIGSVGESPRCSVAGHALNTLQ